MATAYRAKLGIDLDATDSTPAVRIEPGDILPKLSRAQLAGLRAADAIEVAHDEEPASPPSSGEEK